MGTTIIDALHKSIQHTIYTKLQDAFRQRRHGIPIDEFRFLRFKVFHTLYGSLDSAITSIPGPIDTNVLNAVVDGCFNWAQSFANTRLTLLSEDKSSLLSESHVLILVKNLLQDCDNGEVPTQIDDSRLIKISHELLSCMRQYLTDLKDDEELAQSIVKSLSLESFAPVAGMNSQEGVDGDLLDSGQWQNAWNQPFRGKLWLHWKLNSSSTHIFANPTSRPSISSSQWRF